MFFAFPPTSFCLGTALMSPLTVLEAFDFHPFIFSELHFDQTFFPCPTHEILFFSLSSASKFLQILCMLLCWTAISTNMPIWSLHSHLNVPFYNVLNPTLLTYSTFIIITLEVSSNSRNSVILSVKMIPNV